jgi:hypothetical protein
MITAKRRSRRLFSAEDQLSARRGRSASVHTMIGVPCQHGLRELLALRQAGAVSLSMALHDAGLVLDLRDGVLQLLVQHRPVRHDDHAVEVGLAARPVGCESARAPSTRWCSSCPEPGAVLDQVGLAGALSARTASTRAVTPSHWW